MLSEGLSVVMPVFNTSITYLEENLTALFQKKHPFNFEVIVVNDGSTKEEVNAYLRESVEKFPDLRLIEKENAGVAAARNVGIKHAQYNWLTFLDADDELRMADDFSLSDLNQENLYFFDGETFNGKGTQSHLSISKEDHTVTPEGLMKAQLNLDGGNYQGIDSFMASVCWGKLLPTEIIQNQLAFDESLKKREDVVFMSEIYSNVANFSKIDGLSYRYRVENEASLSLKYQQNLSETYMTVYKKLDQIIPYKKELAAYDFNLIHEVLTLDLFHPANKDSKKEKKEIIKKMISLGQTNPYFRKVVFPATIGRNKKILYQALQKEHLWMIFLLYNIKKGVSKQN